MPRIRTIKPEYWDDEKIALLSRDARLVYIALWNFSDDYGVVKGNQLWLKSKIFPYDTIQMKQFDAWIQELQQPGFIVLFQHKSENYYYLPNFCRHQVINKPSQTRNPEYVVKNLKIKYVTEKDLLKKDYGSTTVVDATGVGIGRESDKGMEGEEELVHDVLIPVDCCDEDSLCNDCQEKDSFPEEKNEKTPPSSAKVPLMFPYESLEFMNAWNALMQEPKQKKKTNTARQAMLKQLSEFDEEYAIELIMSAISNNWQGVVFSNTKDNYQKYLKSKNGQSSIFGQSGKSASRQDRDTQIRNDLAQYYKENGNN